MLKKFGFYERKSVEAGKIFVVEGEEAYEAYLIQSGKVRVFTEQDGKEITLAEIGPGNIIGEASLIMNEPRSASVEALEATTMIVITRQDFEKLMGKTDQTIQSVLKLLTSRVKGQNTQTVNTQIENENIDQDSALITESFARSMTPERKEKFIRDVGPHMSNLIKSLKAFKADE